VIDRAVRALWKIPHLQKSKLPPPKFPTRIEGNSYSDGLVHNMYFVMSLTAISLKGAFIRRSRQVGFNLPSNISVERYFYLRSQSTKERLERLLRRVLREYRFDKPRQFKYGCDQLASLQREYGWFREGVVNKVATKPLHELYMWDRLMQLATLTYGWKTSAFLGLGDIISTNASLNGAIRHLTGIPEVDVLLVEEDSHLYRPGHMVVVDREIKRIVVAIRGTMRFQDIITNLTCEQVPFAITTDDNKIVHGKTHEGFLLSAHNLHEELHDKVKLAMEEHKDYSLAICGHSMGGAVATLLSLMWAGEFKNRDVQSFSFAAPCVLCEDASQSEFVKSRVTSIVLGDDMVSRLSLGSFEDLVGACQELGRSAVLSEEKKKLVKRIRTRHRTRKNKLFPSGNVYHIPYLSRYNKSSQEVITAEIIDPCISLREILITPKMFSAHLPSNYLNSIRMQIFLRNYKDDLQNPIIQEFEFVADPNL